MNFLIDGRFGGVVYNSDARLIDSNGVGIRTLEYREGGVVLDAVTATGAVNTSNITAQNYWQQHSAIAENYTMSQTNVRLREMSIGTNLSIAESLGVDSMNISLIGRNLFFLLKKADDIDPEAMLGTNIGGMGIATNNLPTMRSVGLNVTLKF